MAATPPGSSDVASLAFDSAQPFKGLVVCCTSIAADLRTEIATKTVELGGLHKYDLTPDCTHLLVGEYETPKYRHVAKARPDIKVMAPGWVEAVRDIWVQDAEIDFPAMEREWQLRVFETGVGEPTEEGAVAPRHQLLCCMTGFEDPDTREQIAHKISSNGGIYTGDLSRQVTHLIVYKPEGRKYLAAKTWGVKTVSIEWVNDCIERGMILDEKLYDPVLPPAERGVDAWDKNFERKVSLGKRLRENAAAQDEGRRKLCKTASMKLNSQRDNLWGNILGKPSATDPSGPSVTRSLSNPPAPAATAAQCNLIQQPGAKAMDTQGSRLSSFGMPEDGNVFASCCFYIHGFSDQKTEVLGNAVGSLGGLVCRSLDEVVSASGAQLAHRFLIVPQTSAPETHPRLPDNVHIITEFYIERCLHKKYFFNPSEHVIGRPFPAFPIDGFEKLTICTGGFTGVDLNQVDKAIRQLGAKYEERFTADVSLLVCPKLDVVRKQKLEMALAWNVPVVNAEWLWECITTGYNVPIEGFRFRILEQKVGEPVRKGTANAQVGKEKSKQDKTSVGKGPFDKDLLPPKAAIKSKPPPGIDFSSVSILGGERKAPPAKAKKSGAVNDPESAFSADTHFHTAPTHQLETSHSENSNSRSSGCRKAPSAPLSEASSNSLNKDNTPSPAKHEGGARGQRKPMGRITSEIADSEATDGDVCTPGDLPLLADENKHEPSPIKPIVVKEVAKDLKATRERAEAERKAQSSKLALSLLDSAASLTKTLSAASDAGESSGGAVSNTTSFAGAISGTTTTKRRKREILGRAVSNVSAGSSTAGDSGGGPIIITTDGLGLGGKHQQQSNPLSVSATEEDGRPPPATQLEYEDPDAKRYQAQILHKMLGTAPPPGESSFPREERITMAEMAGYGARVPPLGEGRERRSRRK
ncbi:BRCT domain-containing protein [Podospora didyma]|uniref:BRCT domain-containing protein n=1 Tax=Podospora didyma TaxID=330526 RepID=A0AAE0KDF1_9PEZI|nr:BRCT domain-containing protein [Podospora didyma]